MPPWCSLCKSFKVLSLSLLFVTCLRGACLGSEKLGLASLCSWCPAQELASEPCPTLSSFHEAEVSQSHYTDEEAEVGPASGRQGCAQAGAQLSPGVFVANLSVEVLLLTISDLHSVSVVGRGNNSEMVVEWPQV